RLAPNGVLRRTFRISVPDDAAVSEAYFLRTTRSGPVYSWSAAADSVRGLPFEPAPVSVDFSIGAGARLHIAREAQFAAVDKAIGVGGRPRLTVPAASVHVAPAVAAIPAGNSGSRSVRVSVRAARDSMSGVVKLSAPAGWNVRPSQHAVSVAHAGETAAVT